ncbi:MAG: PhzF family phenazine biosynthesis protein [Planctomycetota bacterium]|jgi:PhzF family phenazine biosynthesis protein
MLTYFQVNAFTSEATGGNPAGVVLLDSPLSAGEMQRIAGCHMLPETAFVVLDEQPHIRWFTPMTEMDLCGHATLAAGHVLFSHVEWEGASIAFQYGGGELTVVKSSYGYDMTFPARPAKPVDVPGIAEALGVTPVKVLKSRDVLAVLDSEKTVHELRPDFHALKEIDAAGVMVTAKGASSDFVSRFFAPRVGIDEDPVTGSAHCTLAPYWAEQLGKTTMKARQLSTRGGELTCTVQGENVLLHGDAVTFLKGHVLQFEGDE